MGQRFYVVHTQHGCDDLAYSELKPHFETHHFTVAYEGRIGNQRFNQLQSLFPSYLFVRFDWRSPKAWTIPSMRGVKSLLGYTHKTGKPTPIADKVLEDLKQRFGAFVLEPQGPVAPPEVGDTVIIKQGPFRQHRAVCTMSKEGRVAVLLSVLGGSHMFEMPASAVLSA